MCLVDGSERLERKMREGEFEEREVVSIALAEDNVWLYFSHLLTAFILSLGLDLTWELSWSLNQVKNVDQK